MVTVSFWLLQITNGSHRYDGVESPEARKGLTVFPRILKVPTLYFLEKNIDRFRHANPHAEGPKGCVFMGQPRSVTEDEPNAVKFWDFPRALTLF